MEVRVTAQSQAHRLRERLGEAAVSHGAAVRADLRNVRVTAFAGAPNGAGVGMGVGMGVGVAFFCNLAPIGIRQQISAGDGGPLPVDLELVGLHVAGAGVYDLVNAQVWSNGALRVVVDRETQIVPARPAEPAPRAPAEALFAMMG